MRCRVTLLLVAFFTFAITSSVHAQSFQGGLRGAVLDTTGGVLPGVSLTLTNDATGVARTTVTNGAGEYAFAAVMPGDYTVTATLESFKTVNRKGITVGTQQFLTLDIAMETGNLSEQVVVTGAAPLVETSNASTGEVLSKTVLETLPSQNRNAFLMSVSVPTVVASGDAAYNRMQDQGGASSVSMGGGAVRANNYLLDGVSFAALDNRPSMFPGIELLQELKVQVHTYDAEMGRTGGGVFNATARSGSNDWHGSGFAQNRPVWGATNGFFAERAGVPKSTTAKYWLGGGSLGGSIKKNRTFFWASTEDYLDQRATNGLLIFPTSRERQGDFSQTFDRNGALVVIYDPLTTRPNPNGSGSIRDPFPGNVIPANRLSQTGLAITKLLPTADGDRSGANGAANYVRTAILRSKGNQYSTKIEHKFTDRVSLTGLYAYQKTTEPDSLYFEANKSADSRNWAAVRPTHLIALNNTILASETTVVTLRYGYSHFVENNMPVYPYDTNLAALGFPAAFVNAVVAPKVPSALVDGIGEIGGGLFNRSFGAPATSRRTWVSTSVNGTVSKFVGRHTLKMGADYRKIALNSLLAGQTAGDFFFDRQYTQGPNPLVAASNAGSGLADLLLGYPTGDPSSVSTIPFATPLNVFLHYYAGYAQDDFRVAPNFTLNYGLRYEYETGLNEQEDRFTVAFDRTVASPLAALTRLDLKGGLRYAGQNGFPTYQGDPSKMKFAPRVGVAWSLNSATVVRGGYGMFWAPWTYQSPSTVNYGQIGYTAVTPYNVGTSLIPRTTATGVGGFDDPFPGGASKPVGNTLGLLTGVGTNIDFVDQNRQSPRVQQWSADLQRELPGDTVVKVGYMGASGSHLSLGGNSDGLVNINQLDPTYLALGTALQDQVANPFYNIAQAGPFSQSPTIARGQLLRPFPQFGNVTARQVSEGRSMYHAVVLELNRRLSNGIGGRVSYTWSRLKDNQFGQGNFWSRLNSGALPENNYNLDAEYSYGLLDVPHRIVIAPLAELPFGAGKPWLTSGVGRAVLGDWTITALGMLESGYPLNVTQQNNNTGSLGGTQRPNVSSTDPNTSGNTLDRLDNYINSAAYAAAAPFTFGNAPRTDPRIRTPFRTNWDITLAKRVPMSGGFSGQLRIDLLNAFNQLRFANGPEARVGNPSFGRITAQGGLTRQTQLSFRIAW